MQNTNQTNQDSSFFTNTPSEQSQVSQMSSPLSSQVSETNPFTSDLRGEFTNNFGTNSTSSVSQMFKDGGFAQNNNKKWLILALVFVVCILAAIFLLNSPSSSSFEDEFATDKETTPESTPTDTATTETPTTETAATDSVATEPTAGTEAVQEQATTADTGAVQEQVAEQQPATGSVELLTLPEGSRWDYDETMGPISFSWSGAAGGTIYFSRNGSMNPTLMKIPVSGNSYEFYNPYPGTWYWRVENASGVSEIRSFVVNPPVRRNVALQRPLSGEVLSGNGGEISWTEDSKVAFYRVEFSNSNNFSSPTYKFATSGTRLSTQNIAPGAYQLRIGAFSEVAGRWEYTQPINVTVQ